VVEDQLDVKTRRDRDVDAIEKRWKLHGSVTREAVAEDGAGFDVEAARNEVVPHLT
jgi:hypothetical protein